MVLKMMKRSQCIHTFFSVPYIMTVPHSSTLSHTMWEVVPVWDPLLSPKERRVLSRLIGILPPNNLCIIYFQRCNHSLACLHIYLSLAGLFASYRLLVHATTFALPICLSLTGCS